VISDANARLSEQGTIENLASARRAAQEYLVGIAFTIGRDLSAADQIDSQIVSLDIEKVRLLANAGLHWAKERDRIQAACKALGLDEDQWCRDTWGRSIVTLRGYRQVGREWDRYLVERRKLGNHGQVGIELARSLVPMNGRGTNARHPSVHSETLDISRCQFITDDASLALKKMDAESVSVIATSPPYYPLRRDYGGPFGGLAVGWEPTIPEYINHLVKIFDEARRVLTKRGTLIVIMRDSYSTNTGDRYRPRSHQLDRDIGWKHAGISQHVDRPLGNLLFIPERFAMAMQDGGWICRMNLPVRVRAQPASADDRPDHDCDRILVFVKQRNYFWNSDAVRVPASATNNGMANPTGRNASSVMEFSPSHYRGTHTATTPVAMARWILSAACDDEAHVCDPFGGAGTFALVALQMGYRATTIDINDNYTREARERLSKAPATLQVNEQD
jgi:DNA modification methylase